MSRYRYDHRQQPVADFMSLPVNRRAEPCTEALRYLDTLNDELCFGRLTEEKRERCLELLARAKSSVRDAKARR